MMEARRPDRWWSLQELGRGAGGLQMTVGPEIVVRVGSRSAAPLSALSPESNAARGFRQGTPLVHASRRWLAPRSLVLKDDDDNGEEEVKTGVEPNP